MKSKDETDASIYLLDWVGALWSASAWARRLDSSLMLGLMFELVQRLVLEIARKDLLADVKVLSVNSCLTCVVCVRGVGWGESRGFSRRISRRGPWLLCWRIRPSVKSCRTVCGALRVGIVVAWTLRWLVGRIWTWRTCWLLCRVWPRGFGGIVCRGCFGRVSRTAGGVACRHQRLVNKELIAHQRSTYLSMVSRLVQRLDLV